MNSRWSVDKINDWYQSLPYLFGANFIPSNAVNQLEMWQAKTFDTVTIKRELGYANQIGMNTMRVYIHDLLWEQDREGFCKRVEEYLSMADYYQIKTIFVFFDDCWCQNFYLGEQPTPLPFTHNSRWVQSPGKSIVRDSTKWIRLEEYVVGILKHFKDDRRILFWDLYNEPGNDASGNKSDPIKSLPLLREVFSWARSVNGLTQPLTTCLWNESNSFNPLNDFAFNNSDLITFHDYSKPSVLIEKIKKISSSKRPLICTEYMARGNGSTFEKCLPILKAHHIGAINWGLVSGKTQTIYPWDWSEKKGNPSVLFHDIFNQDGSFLYADEKPIFKFAL